MGGEKKKLKFCFCFFFLLNAYGHLVAGLECLVCELEKQAALTHTAVTDDDELEEKVCGLSL